MQESSFSSISFIAKFKKAIKHEVNSFRAVDLPTCMILIDLSYSYHFSGGLYLPENDKQVNDLEDQYLTFVEIVQSPWAASFSKNLVEIYIEAEGYIDYFTSKIQEQIKYSNYKEAIFRKTAAARLFKTCGNICTTLDDSNILVLDFCGLNTQLNRQQVQELYDSLKGNFIANDTKLKHFQAALTGKKVSFDYAPIRWIKKTKKSKLLSKVSLKDFIELCGISEINLTQINQLFANQDGNSIQLKPSHLYNNKTTKCYSEYYSELEQYF